ncbi:mitochondrial aspartate-glutamate transporter agc1, partial [Spiromyces aspiralis]
MDTKTGHNSTASSAFGSPVTTTATSSLGAKLAGKLVNGAVAGITGVLVIYPFDIVKTRLQNQVPDGRGVLPYKGGVDCFRQIVTKEGPRGLYRVPNLAGITPEKAIKLAVNDFMRERLARTYGTTVEDLPLVGGMIAGATAGFCQVIATNPMEIVKIQMQIAGQHATTQHISSNSAAAAPTKSLTARQVVQSLGLKGLYRGTPATLLRDVPFSFIFFPGQAYFSKVIDGMLNPSDHAGKGSKRPSFGAVFLGSTVAGVVSAAAVTPADVIKTRLQVSPRNGGAPQYKTISEAASSIFRNEGLGAFFKGLVPRCLITAPMFGIALLTYNFQQ